MNDKSPESDSNKDDPKIVVDDDWKTQVEAEKEKLQKEMQSEPSQQPEIPPASFSMLVTTLASQAMVSMGIFPDPTGQLKPDKAFSKHMIDTLDVLVEKTKGNLTKEEEQLLSETLHQLRMAFVTIPNSPAAGAETSSDAANESKKPTIELP